MPVRSNLRSAHALAISIALLLQLFTAQAATKTSAIVVAIGGNSECIGHFGMRSLFHKSEADRDKKLPPNTGILVRSVAGALKISPEEIDARYYSWTGDPADHEGCLPGNLDWIVGGSAIIQRQFSALDSPKLDVKVVIVGWSNGAATAYELACDLTRKHRGRVGLLVTLDPVSYTTRTCMTDDEQAQPLYPGVRWINVYTESSGWAKFFNPGNIIALLGHAWNEDFPRSRAARARPLIHIKPANHGDVACMWARCVIPQAPFSAAPSTPLAVGGLSLPFNPSDLANCGRCDVRP